MFPARRRLMAKAATRRDLPAIASAAGIDGGRVDDALVGLAVREAGGALVPRDRRALPTYWALDVEFAG